MGFSLSQVLGLSSATPDPNLAVALQQQQQQQAAAKAAAEAEAARAREAELRAQARSSAVSGAAQSARDYFANRGLDPNVYGSNIDAAINDILSRVNEADPNPGSYFNDVGANVYSDLESAGRNRALTSVDQRFGPDYASGRIGSNVADPYIEDILQSQRGDVDRYINNLLARGVIKESGAEAARKDVGRQEATAKEKLRGIGESTIASGRGGIEDIIGQARSAAGSVRLGQNFDPSSYESRVNESINSFLSGLPNAIQSQVTEPLFSVGDLPALAGAASGAQNTNFDPKAIAGVYQTEEEKKKKKEEAAPTGTIF